MVEQLYRVVTEYRGQRHGRKEQWNLELGFVGVLGYQAPLF
jgi:hypothetical protein